MDYWIGLTESEDTWDLVPDYVRIFNQILDRSVEEFTRSFYGDFSSISSVKDQLREIFRYFVAFDTLYLERDSFKPFQEEDFNEYAVFKLREKYEVVCRCYRELTFPGIEAKKKSELPVRALEANRVGQAKKGIPSGE